MGLVGMGLQGMAPAERSLPAAEVRFPEDFRARLAALELRLSAARRRREGQGTAGPATGGTDVVGFRPYRPGEDLRQLDWNLLARLDRPFVRVTRREAGESWVVALDTSASMGVGPPGKLQRGAECAAALWSLGRRLGARVRLALSPGAGSRAELFEGGGRNGAEGVLAFLEGRRAAGTAGLDELLEAPAWSRDASRLFAIGDLGLGAPERLFALRRGARELSLLQLCAPQELSPQLGAVEWWDPEDGELLSIDVGEAECSRYHALLEQRLESWRALAARHRVAYACRSSAEDFEELVRDLVAA